MPISDRSTAAQALDPDSASPAQAAAIPETAGAGAHETPGVSYQVVETLQTVLTALILAFIFRAYLIEAFIIPTGSMAESLLGEHGARVCPACGWSYTFGPTRTGYAPGRAFQEGITVRCPNCHAALDLPLEDIRPKAGDRILVHKWPYVIGGWLGPKRWDVVVFKDPYDPTQNFIKRLIALPGERVQIVDGDIYIAAPGEEEFRIARKTAAAQSVLWHVLFDQDYLPHDADDNAEFAPWVEQHDPESAESAWTGLGTRTITFRSVGDRPRSIRFAPAASQHYWSDTSGYNRGTSGSDGAPPIVGDLRIVADVDWQDGGGIISFEIERDGRVFRATIAPFGDATLHMHPSRRADQELLLGHSAGTSGAMSRLMRVEFSHVDYRVTLKINGRECLATNDAQYAPDPAELAATRRVAAPEVRIAGVGRGFALHHLRIDRDVYYLAPASALRGTARNPFALGPDDYFVLGDNSAHSHDARFWPSPSRDEILQGELGPHMRPRYDRGEYRVGTVASDQIVGRAFFVYLPGLLSPDERGHWKAIPDIGRARFVR